MGAGAKVFYAIGVFLTITAVIYAFGTNYVGDDAYLYGYEWAGGVALILASAFSFMLGGYLNFTENRSDVLPEDWEEAEVEDGAGVLGFFSPGSIWPLAMTGGICLMAFGIAFWQLWLLALGAVVLIWATTKLNLQYGIPREKH
ncbi:Cytochrome c oxidase subunit IV [Corynebacterium appendicis CIP 107643]|uniref:Cytochrome c oxidase polypeptide 4 n=1 Tax=Corynebacterium appendicis CIP 107643 TaxID=1161099 RepID=A0A1N7J068_9CORY|nr:cytochrome c oxidase subunit 4 [Corynebacterium appendicis]WJY61518.1 Cytochrome c oxidase polypeptide 4 [Corynebacterium appendicis CIP 107643]SIS42753.1 Cytochrome c oxidase subunit IV [Corynebacterium appendicis CIP 107643]